MRARPAFFQPINLDVMSSLPQPEPKAIILFDGVCNLCSSSVQRVIANDPAGYFKFASLQSEAGRALLASYRQPAKHTPDSVMLIEDGKVYQQSTAALRIARKMKGAYPLLYPLLLVPPFLRNLVYQFIARNRYKWWGKQESCWLPAPELKSRFL